MAAGNDVYDPSDYRAVAAFDDLSVRAGMEGVAGPTNAGGSGSHRVGLFTSNGGGMMTKSNLRSVAYFAIVGGVVCWLVAHLAPIRG